MNNGELEVIIQDNPIGFDAEVYIIRRVENGTQVFKVNEDGELEGDGVVPPGGAKSVLPTVRLPKPLLQSFFDALQKQGMKPTSQSFVEGKLVATEEHLKDMRALVFEPKEVIGISETPKL